MSLQNTIDWKLITDEDLKDAKYLEKRFKKFLKKICGYNTEEANFAGDIIDEPFSRNYNNINREYETTIEINKKKYEVYFCTLYDCAKIPFEFYTLVDLDTIKECNDKVNSYVGAIKKFVL